MNATECTQPAMLTAGVATYRLWRERGGAVPASHGRAQSRRVQRAGGGGQPRFQSRGRSGEVSRRSHAGRGARRVRAPWRPMLGPRGHRGRSRLSQKAAQGEVVEAVNFNAPGQVVIAGAAAAVARAIEAATAKGARRAVALPISVPAHSSLMRPRPSGCASGSTGVAGGSGRGHHGLRGRHEDPSQPDEIRAGSGQTAAYARLLGRDGAHDDRRGRHATSSNAVRARC